MNNPERRSEGVWSDEEFVSYLYFYCETDEPHWLSIAAWCCLRNIADCEDDSQATAGYLDNFFFVKRQLLRRGVFEYLWDGLERHLDFLISQKEEIAQNEYTRALALAQTLQFGKRELSVHAAQLVARLVCQLEQCNEEQTPYDEEQRMIAAITSCHLKKRKPEMEAFQNATNEKLRKLFADKEAEQDRVMSGRETITNPFMHPITSLADIGWFYGNFADAVWVANEYGVRRAVFKKLSFLAVGIMASASCGLLSAFIACALISQIIAVGSACRLQIRFQNEKRRLQADLAQRNEEAHLQAEELAFKLLSADSRMKRLAEKSRKAKMTEEPQPKDNSKAAGAANSNQSVEELMRMLQNALIVFYTAYYFAFPPEGAQVAWWNVWSRLTTSQAAAPLEAGRCCARFSGFSAAEMRLFLATSTAYVAFLLFSTYQLVSFILVNLVLLVLFVLMGCLCCAAYMHVAQSGQTRELSL